jgi:hypothetical protein
MVSRIFSQTKCFLVELRRHEVGRHLNWDVYADTRHTMNNLQRPEETKRGAANRYVRRRTYQGGGAWLGPARRAGS